MWLKSPTDFLTPYQSTVEGGVLKSPNKYMNLPISPFSSICICFVYFKTVIKYIIILNPYVS